VTGLPVVLVILDGLGDRPLPALRSRTPAEAARTPVLDALAWRGATGLHLPFGWGRAPSSEVAHWALLGYTGVPFPGRAVLEALGAGLDVPAGVPHLYAGLRPAEPRADGELWLGPAPGAADAEECASLFAALDGLEVARGVSFGFAHVRRGEAIVTAPRLPSAAVTDSDPLFDDRPWLAPLGREDVPDALAAERAAALVWELLRASHARLRDHPVNLDRIARGAPALDVLTTKWSGVRGDVPAFAAQVGVPGGAVTSSGLYRGLAALLGLARRDLETLPDAGADMTARLGAAEALLDAGAAFVHVHTKVTDEAGHTKDPLAKLHVLQALDPGLRGLHALARRAIVCVTGDHATPSSGPELHSGDPVPLLVAGPTVRRDAVHKFGEAAMARGVYGHVRAAELLPLLLGHADRARFMGQHTAPRDTLARPAAPVPMRLA
jgi:2,3-bisphosphoglycerate-independent phosphoglycerate mutase